MKEEIPVQAVDRISATVVSPVVYTFPFQGALFAEFVHFNQFHIFMPSLSINFKFSREILPHPLFCGASCRRAFFHPYFPCIPAHSFKKSPHKGLMLRIFAEEHNFHASYVHSDHPRAICSESFKPLSIFAGIFFTRVGPRASRSIHLPHSGSRRIKRRMSGYVTLDATQKTSRKTSKNGELFVSESLIP